MMKKIAILTLFHKNYNWGGVLQGYALRRKILSLYAEREEDVCVDILKYYSDYNPIYPSLLRQMSQYSIQEKAEKITRKICQKFQGKRKKTVEKKLEDRFRLFDHFTESITTNQEQYDDDGLKKIAPEYFAFISGSDQVWNPNVARRGFLQIDIPSCCRKIAYAASVARNDLSEQEQKIMIPFISEFDFISVREKTAQSFLKKYLPADKTINEVLDPTLMITQREWEELIGEPKCPTKRYALAFFFSDSYEYRKQIGEYCRENKLILKFIPHAKEYLENDEKGVGERQYSIGPIEFLRLFQNAECVFMLTLHASYTKVLF